MLLTRVSIKMKSVLLLLVLLALCAGSVVGLGLIINYYLNENSHYQEVNVR